MEEGEYGEIESQNSFSEGREGRGKGEDLKVNCGLKVCLTVGRDGRDSKWKSQNPVLLDRFMGLPGAWSEEILASVLVERDRSCD